MKIALIQTHPEKGDIEANLADHIHWIGKAGRKQADLVIFPELSLTGYEPSLANDLAMDLHDPRLDFFQQCSDQFQMGIGLGLPLRWQGGISIALAIFQPGIPRSAYGKQLLHEDEMPFFAPGPEFAGFQGDLANTALAICYELSIAEHVDAAANAGASLYLASVAKDAAGVEKASLSLSGYARKYEIMTCMVNCIGPSEGFHCTGGTAVWNPDGELVAQIEGEEPGLLIFDWE